MKCGLVWWCKVLVLVEEIICCFVVKVLGVGVLVCSFFGGNL